MTDDEIDTLDILPLSDELFSKAKLRMPDSSVATVAGPVDSETLSTTSEFLDLLWASWNSFCL
ncbi:MAG: hypothetical protein NW237_10650 [Cyanobacteriota bacterium]|nr:hypothetical protein [Cyanobacteriota bacterium]